MLINQPLDASMISDSYQQKNFLHKSVENLNNRIEDDILQPWISNLRTNVCSQTQHIQHQYKKSVNRKFIHNKAKYNTICSEKLRMSIQQSNLQKANQRKKESWDLNFFKPLTKQGRQFLRSSITKTRNASNIFVSTKSQQSNDSFRGKQIRPSIEENKDRKRNGKIQHITKFDKFLNTKSRSMSRVIIGHQQESKDFKLHRKTKHQSQINIELYSENKSSKCKTFSQNLGNNSQIITKYKQKSQLQNKMVLATNPYKCNKKLIVLHKYSFLKGNPIFKKQIDSKVQKTNQKQTIDFSQKLNLSKLQKKSNSNHALQILESFNKQCYNKSTIQNWGANKQQQHSIYKSCDEILSEFDRKCKGILAIGVSRNTRQRNYTSLKKKPSKSLFTVQTQVNDDKGTFTLQSSDNILTPKGIFSHDKIKSLRKVKMHKAQNQLKRQIKISVNSEKKIEPRSNYSVVYFPAD